MRRVQLLSSLLLVCLIVPEFAKADLHLLSGNEGKKNPALNKAAKMLASPVVKKGASGDETSKKGCAFGGIDDSIGMLGKGFFPLLANPLGSETVIEPGSGSEALAAWKNRCLTTQRASESKLSSEQSFNSFSNTYGIEAAGSTKYFPNVPPVGIQVNGEAYKESVVVSRTFSHVKELGIVSIEDDCLVDSMSHQFKVAVLKLNGLEFDPSNTEVAERFYKFFAAWGTLYVDSVTYGAMVYAYESRKLDSSGVSGKAVVDADVEKVVKGSVEASGASSSVSGHFEVQGSVVGGTMSATDSDDGLEDIKAEFGKQKDNRLTDIATSSAFAGMTFETGPETAAPIAYNLKPISNLLVNFHHRVTADDLRAAFPTQDTLSQEEKQNIARIYPNVRAALKGYNSLIVSHRAKVDMMVPVAERMEELVGRFNKGHHFSLSSFNPKNWERNIKPKLIPTVIEALGHMYGVATKDALQKSAKYFLKMMHLPVPVFHSMLNQFKELEGECAKLLKRWNGAVVPYRWESFDKSNLKQKTAVLTSLRLDDYRDGFVDVTNDQRDILTENAKKDTKLVERAVKMQAELNGNTEWVHKPIPHKVESFELPALSPPSEEDLVEAVPSVVESDRSEARATRGLETRRETELETEVQQSGTATDLGAKAASKKKVRVENEDQVDRSD